MKAEFLTIAGKNYVRAIVCGETRKHHLVPVDRDNRHPSVALGMLPKSDQREALCGTIEPSKTPLDLDGDVEPDDYAEGEWSPAIGDSSPCMTCNRRWHAFDRLGRAEEPAPVPVPSPPPAPAPTLSTAKREPQTEAERVARNAILHLLSRIRTDPDVRFHFVGTESLELLVTAYVELTGRTLDEVTAWMRTTAFRPHHQEARERVLENRVAELERSLERVRRSA